MLLNASPSEEPGVTPLYKEGHSSSEVAGGKFTRNRSEMYTANAFKDFIHLSYSNY
jgi:hypothetical protein